MRGSRRRRSSGRPLRHRGPRLRGSAAIANDNPYPDGRRLLEEPGSPGAGQRRVQRRQRLLQPQDHRRPGRRTALRRLRHERDGLEGGGPPTCRSTCSPRPSSRGSSRRRRAPAPNSSATSPSPARWAGCAPRRRWTWTSGTSPRFGGLNEEVHLDEVIQVYLPLSRLLNLYVSATQDLYKVTDTFLGPTRRCPT